MSSQAPQPNTIPEEWLSAFLDDELDADQRRLVESAVSQNPQLAQLLQDLQATRSLVQQLPSFPSSASLRRSSSSADQEISDLDDGLPDQLGSGPRKTLPLVNDSQLTERLLEDHGFSNSVSDQSLVRTDSRTDSWFLSHWRAVALAASIVGVAVVGSLSWYGVFGGRADWVASAPLAPGSIADPAHSIDRNLMDSEGGPSATGDLQPMASQAMGSSEFGVPQLNASMASPAMPDGSPSIVAQPPVAEGAEALAKSLPPPPMLFETFSSPGAVEGASLPESTLAMKDLTGDAGATGPSAVLSDGPAGSGALAGALSQAPQIANQAEHFPPSPVAGVVAGNGPESLSNSLPSALPSEVAGGVGTPSAMFGEQNARTETLPRDKISLPKRSFSDSKSAIPLPSNQSNEAGLPAANAPNTPSAGMGAGRMDAAGGMRGMQGGMGGSGMGGSGMGGRGSRSMDVPPQLPNSNASNDDRQLEATKNLELSQLESLKAIQSTNPADEKRLANPKKSLLITQAVLHRSSAWTNDEMLAQLESNALLRQVKALRQQRNVQPSTPLPEAKIAPATLAIVSLEPEQRRKLFQLVQQVGLDSSIQDAEQTTYAIFLSRKELDHLQLAVNNSAGTSIRFTMVTGMSDQSSEKCVLIVNPK